MTFQTLYLLLEALLWFLGVWVVWHLATYLHGLHRPATDALRTPSDAFTTFTSPHPPDTVLLALQEFARRTNRTIALEQREKGLVVLGSNLLPLDLTGVDNWLSCYLELTPTGGTLLRIGIIEKCVLLEHETSKRLVRSVQNKIIREIEEALLRVSSLS